MEGDNNIKTFHQEAPRPANGEEKNLLAREEIKTMEKDISRLRETEAVKEREKMARIKTEEEIIREKQRTEQAKISAQERETAEKEARAREERFKKLREERETKEKTLETTQTEMKKDRIDKFESSLNERQIKENEERQRFLARVEAKAEGRAEPLPPAPPIAKTVNPANASFKKPDFSQKIWIRIVLSLLITAIAAGIATFIYWYFVIREKPPTETETSQTPAADLLTVPAALFYVESSQTITVRQINEIPSPLFQAVQENIDSGTTSRIIIEDIKNNKILGLKEFFDAFSIAPPENFYDKLENDFTLFVYSQEEGNRLGLVAKIKDQSGLAEALNSWEETIEEDSNNLFVPLGKNQPALSPYFKDASYRGTNFRFQTFSRDDLGIVYSIYGDYFILTSSWKSMEKALDKLKEITPSSFFSPENGAEFILGKLDLESKIGQLFFIGINGTTLTPETEKLIAGIKPGGILLLKKNVVNEAQTKKLVHDIQQAALKNYGIPLFIGVDQEGGEISPVNFIREKTGQSEIETADEAYAVGLSRGEELKNLGINLNLAPVLDEAEPGDFVFGRAFRADDTEADALVKALISGQKTASILTAIKHFPGYGDIAFDPEDKLATLNETPETALFEKAGEAQPEFVMTSNVIYSEIDADQPFSFSPKGITLLKKTVGTAPLIMTDDLPQPSLIDKFSLKGVVTLPIKAGADILTFSNNWETTLAAAALILDESVRNGEIAAERIDDSVLKIIKLKKAYYSYEPPHQNEFYKK